MFDLSNWVIVFDLDDTLYKEIDYVMSGRKYILQLIEDVLGRPAHKNYDAILSSPVSIDVLGEICSGLSLPSSIKDSILWAYRLHMPQINLEKKVENALKNLLLSVKAVAVLTDGRSITQRLKLKSLGLGHLPCYISEEWMSEKPEIKRFVAIEEQWPNSRYVYVGDNILKDFIAPNSLGWLTLGLRDDGRNIYPQNINVQRDCLPSYWIDCLGDIERFLRNMACSLNRGTVC